MRRRNLSAQGHVRGFTLIEVLVSLAIVATALVAGLQASAAMTRNAERQADRVLAQVCAENAIAKLRLQRLLPDVGDSISNCEQSNRIYELRFRVQPTPNPNFRRIDAHVTNNRQSVLQLSTIVGRY
jgi:general secretion pathway protein I